MASVVFDPSTRPPSEQESVTSSGREVDPEKRQFTQTSRPIEVSEAIRTPKSVEPTFDDEERYIFGLLVLFVATMVLPALALIVYLFFNPDALMYDVKRSIR